VTAPRGPFLTEIWGGREGEGDREERGKKREMGRRGAIAPLKGEEEQGGIFNRGEGGKGLIKGGSLDANFREEEGAEVIYSVRRGGQS